MQITGSKVHESSEKFKKARIHRIDATIPTHQEKGVSCIQAGFFLMPDYINTQALISLEQYTHL